MAACNKSSSNNIRNDDSKQLPEPSATTIARNSNDSQNSILHPPHPHPLPPPLPNDHNIFSSPPPCPPPSSSSSSSSRILSYTRIKSQGKQCWSSIKSNFNKVVREPARKRQRRWSSSLRWSSEESSGGGRSTGSRWNNKNEKDYWPEDEEESLFCEGLVGLMRRCGRMGMVDDGLAMTIADDGDSDGGKEGRGSDSSVPQVDLNCLGP